MKKNHINFAHLNKWSDSIASQWSRDLSQPKSRQDDEPKIKFAKPEFGVAMIVYFEKLRKNQKNKTRSTKNQILGLGVGYAC